MLYEKTNDRAPYLIRIARIGKLNGQMARMVSPVYQYGKLKYGIMASEADGKTSVKQIEIGGRYSALADAFIIATIKSHANRTIVAVEEYEAIQ